MSNEITRFNHVTDWGMERDAHGDYVLHSAHEAEVARLRAELNAATKAGLDAIATICEKEREADALRVDAERYREAIGIVCEGFTLPNDVRKILEKAMWSDAAMGEGK